MSDISQSFTWIADASGDWSDAANWADITTGQTPAVAPPGFNDIATIDTAGTISGAGAALSLTFIGHANIAATLDVGTLAAPGGLFVTGQVEAGAVDASGVLVAFGTLAAETLKTASLDFIGGGAIQTDQLSTPSGTLVIDQPEISVAGFGAIEVGSSGTGTADALTVDPGVVLQVGTLLFHNYNNNIVDPFTNVDLVVNGGIVTANGRIGDYYLDATQQPNPAELITTRVAGTGTIEVTANGTLDLIANVTSPGLTFQLDGGAILIIQGSIDEGTTINLLGTGNTIEVLQNTSAAPHGGEDYPFIAVSSQIEGFNNTDLIEISNEVPGTITNISSSVSVALSAGTLSLLGSFTADEFQTTTLSVADPSTYVITTTATGDQSVACFVEGTHVQMRDGLRPIQNIQVGDSVVTVSGCTREVLWIGHRRVDCKSHSDPERVMPIRIAPHAFGQGRPSRALYLSPDHAVYMEGVLIPIKFLVNDLTIAQMQTNTVTFYHIELGSHDVIVADGLPCETYLDTGGRSAFDNSPVVQLNPILAPDDDHVAEIWRREGYAPLIGDTTTLQRVQALLAWQAVMLGYLDGASALEGERRCA